MNKRIIGQFGILVAVLLIVTCTAATAQHYALAVSSSKLYVVQASGSSVSSTQLIDFGNSEWSRDVAMYGNDKVIVTEVSGAGSFVRVFQLTYSGGTFKASEITSSKMTLSSVRKAGALAVTSTGGIYVGDDSTGSARYAYISSLGGTPQIHTIATGTINHSQFVDVATSGDKAFMVSQNEDSPINGLSYISTLQSGTTGSPQATALTLGSDPRYPRAVAALGDYTYVASKIMSDTTSGALSVYNGLTNEVVSTNTLSGFIPTDITAFTLGGVDYLALIGTSGGLPTALKTTIDGGTLGTFTSTRISSIADLTAGFQCTASPLGDALWFTQPSKGSVGILNTDSWSGVSSASIGDQITALAAFDVTTIPVPEPSSIIALATFGIGMIGFFRRRSQA